MQISSRITILSVPTYLVAELCEAFRDLALVVNMFCEQEGRCDGDGFGRKDSPRRKRRQRLTQWGLLH